MSSTQSTVIPHRIGTREEWLAARDALLIREKQHTRLGDELAQARRSLPWVRIEKVSAYKRRMGWRLPWVSTARTDFNVDLGFSHSEADGREVVEQMMGAGLPPIVEHNARASGTDAAGYMTESPGFSSFVLEDGAVYHTYSTTWRGLEFLMGY